MAIHLKPTAEELQVLDDMFSQVSQHFGTSRGIIMRDLSAGRSELTQAKNSPKANPWLLGHDTAGGKFPYDRLLVHESLHSSVVKGSKKFVNFTETFSLTKEQEVAVNDHYAIEVELKFDGPKLFPTTEDVSPSQSAASSFFTWVALALLLACCFYCCCLGADSPSPSAVWNPPNAPLVVSHIAYRFTHIRVRR
jgi:hypothetical protein